MCAVRVVEPLNPGSPGMPSGLMTSPCVMTVPNCLQKVSNKPVAPTQVLFTEDFSISLASVGFYSVMQGMFIYVAYVNTRMIQSASQRQ